MNSLNVTSVGDYVVIVPIENLFVDLWKGKVAFSNSHFDKNDIVYYLRKDRNHVRYNEQDIHVVLHNLIFLKEIDQEEKSKFKLELDSIGTDEFEKTKSLVERANELVEKEKSRKEI